MKDAKQSDQDANLKNQLEDLRKDLAKEKAEKQKKDKQTAKEAAEWEAQRTILDSKLEAFRSKLRSTKDQLKETREELQKAQVAAAERRTTIADNPRKRNIARFDPDATIGTPGDMPAAKRNKPAASALPGDKSTFSITPFLNRTLSMAPDSPEEPKTADDEEDVDEKVQEQDNTVPAISVQAPDEDLPLPVISRGASNPKPKKAGVLNVAPQKSNARATARKAPSLPVLEKVAEEGDEENEGHQADDSDADVAEGKGKQKAAPVEVQKPQVKKKHKILGGNREKTLFDDDDANAPKQTRKNLFGGPIGGLNMRGGRTLSVPKGGLRVGFGTGNFSPLKKDRRSAAA
jgi:hypothetical protein